MSEMLLVNSNISYCRILQKLGAGVGEVYPAEDIKPDLQVALKIVPQDFIETAGGGSVRDRQDFISKVAIIRLLLVSLILPSRKRTI